jgi:membrane protease subunit HflK
MSLIDVPTPVAPALPAPTPAPARPMSLRAKIAWAVVAVWPITAVYVVPADQQAVVTRLGRVVEPRVLPGIHVALPWPVDIATKLKVRQLQRLEVGGDLVDGLTGRAKPLASQFLTGDQNLIQLRVIVQYSVSVPVDYLFRHENVASTVKNAVEAALAARIASRPVDAVLTTEKAAIQETVRAAAQRVLNDGRSGVELSTINIESVAPPAEAADAFRDVASARADSARIVSEAQGYANDLLPKARGEAQQLLQAAEGYKQRKINEAIGDADRFRQVAAEYAKASQVNGHRLYMEAMETILPRIKKLIVDKSGNLDLTILRKGDKP